MRPNRSCRRVAVLAVTLAMAVVGMGGCVNPTSHPEPTTAPPTTSSTPLAPDGTEPAVGRYLAGKTFRLVETWTDAGSSRMRKDIDFRLTFTEDAATADGDCGRLTYSDVRFRPTGEDRGELSLGEPDGPACTVGADPAGPPQGRLRVFWSGQRLSLATGFVGWNFVVS